MPRFHRLDYPGHLYHVIVRGVERRAIFRHDGDRYDFLRRLKDGILKTGSKCLTWALMPNHLHLLLIAGAQGLAALMHPLLTGYVGGFNRRHKRVGHLVQNRFKSILCEEDTYARELLRYIALNPVRAGLVKTPLELAQYPWAGHAALLGKASVPWQSVSDALRYFGPDPDESRKRYEDFIIEGWSDKENEELQKNLARVNGVLRSMTASKRSPYESQILGSDAFIAKIVGLARPANAFATQPAPVDMTIEGLKLFVAQMKNIDVRSIGRPDRSRNVSEARALFVYGAIQILGKTQTFVAQDLGISSSSASEAFRRGQMLSARYGVWESIKK